MVAYVKRAGVWTKSKDIRNKQNGSWKPSAKAVYYKQNGVWTMVHNNVIPSIDDVMLNLELVTGQEKVSGWAGTITNKWRFFRNRVRLSSTIDNPDLKLIRVLVSKTGFASSPNSQGYYAEHNDTYPNEAWSDFDFTTQSSTDEKNKNFPVGASIDNQDVLPGGQTYYVTAFAQDVRGSWGLPVTRTIVIPNNFGPDPTRRYEARFVPHDAATYRYNPPTGESHWSHDTLDTGLGYNNSQTETLFFYGQDILDGLGQVANPTIATAQIYLQRSTQDVGPAGAADVRIGAHNYGQTNEDVSNLTFTIPAGDIYLGTLLKGEGKWFTLEQGVKDVLEMPGIKGLKLYINVPYVNTPLASQIRLEKPEFAPRQGELALTWTES